MPKSIIAHTRLFLICSLLAGPAIQAQGIQPRSRAIDRDLYGAAEEGNIQYMTALIRDGANVNAAIRGDGSPLIGAARQGHRNAVELLILHGADLNMPVPGDGNPLIMAAAAGHLQIVELLLNRGARIDDIVPGDENALIRASGSGHLNVVRLLVSRGADINSRVWVGPDPFHTNGEWRSPLSMAQHGKHQTVIDYLISSGARSN